MASLNYARLSKKPSLFKSFTGLEVEEFDAIYKEIESKHDECERKRLSKRKRRERDVGASWQMAFLSPDNTYTRSYIMQKQEVNGQEVYVLKYGPENTPSFTWISKNYPIPLRDEYKDPISGQIISVYELVEYGGTQL